MPPNPTTRCCRALQRPVHAPIEAIWVTDDVLAHAFERFCYVSRGARRAASSAPGPMEARRRLGKRQMTELGSFQAHAALPPWAIPNPVDLSQWKWQAPTPSSGRAKTATSQVELPWTSSIPRAAATVPSTKKVEVGPVVSGTGIKSGLSAKDSLSFLSAQPVPLVKDAFPGQTLAMEEVNPVMPSQETPPLPPQPLISEIPSNQTAAAEDAKPETIMEIWPPILVLPRLNTKMPQRQKKTRPSKQGAVSAAPLSSVEDPLITQPRKGTSPRLEAPVSSLLTPLTTPVPDLLATDQTVTGRASPRLQLKTLNVHQRIMLLEVKGDISAEDFEFRFDDFLRYFEERLLLGRLSKEHIQKHFFHALRMLAEGHTKFPGLVETLERRLIHATVHGINNSRHGPERASSKQLLVDWEPLLWQTILRRLAEEPVSKASGQAFVLVMKNVSSNILPRIQSELAVVLRTYFDTWRGFQVSEMPEKWDAAAIAQALNMASLWMGRLDRDQAWAQLCLDGGSVDSARAALSRVKRHVKRVERFMHKAASLMSDDESHIRTISEALESISPRRHQNMLITMTRMVLAGTGFGWSRSRYNWLCVLARMKRVDSAAFMDMLSLFPNRSHSALSDVELCNLFLHHWASRGRLCRPSLTRKLYQKIMRGDDYLAFGSLALAINKTESPTSCTSLYWSYWTFLRSVKRGRKYLKSLKTLRKSQSLSSRMIQRVAWTSHDHRVAVDLYDFCVAITRRQGLIWPPAFWDKFAAMITPRSKVLRITDGLMGLHPGHRNMPAGAGHGTEAGGQDAADDAPIPYSDVANCRRREHRVKRRLGRLKWSSSLISNARRLRDREAFRYVSKCIAIIEKEKGSLSALDLAPLAKVVTRELNRGQAGRTQRVRWFLTLVRRHLGEEAVVKVGLFFNQQRNANYHIWQRELEKRRQGGVPSDPFEAMLNEQQKINSHSSVAMF